MFWYVLVSFCFLFLRQTERENSDTKCSCVVLIVQFQKCYHLLLGQNKVTSAWFRSSRVQL